MKKLILVYLLDGETKVEYFEDTYELEKTYNCVKYTFGNRFKLGFVGSIRNELEFEV